VAFMHIQPVRVHRVGLLDGNNFQHSDLANTVLCFKLIDSYLESTAQNIAQLNGLYLIQLIL
jgi:hypothetical protein